MGNDDDDEIEVKYLKQVGNGHAQVDQPHYLSWIDKHECKVVSAPDITRRGTYYFQ